MIRTQIQLTEEQSAMLKQLSGKQGVSVAELIRRSIDHYIRSTEQVTHQGKKAKNRQIRYPIRIFKLRVSDENQIDGVRFNFVGVGGRNCISEAAHKPSRPDRDEGQAVYQGRWG